MKYKIANIQFFSCDIL